MRLDDRKSSCPLERHAGHTCLGLEISLLADRPGELNIGAAWAATTPQIRGSAQQAWTPSSVGRLHERRGTQHGGKKNGTGKRDLAGLCNLSHEKPPE
jgi:hypothetical protein